VTQLEKAFLEGNTRLALVKSSHDDVKDLISEVKLLRQQLKSFFMHGRDIGASIKNGDH
jgi:hypothetical protein